MSTRSSTTSSSRLERLWNERANAERRRISLALRLREVRDCVQNPSTQRKTGDVERVVVSERRRALPRPGVALGLPDGAAAPPAIAVLAGVRAAPRGAAQRRRVPPARPRGRLRRPRRRVPRTLPRPPAAGAARRGGAPGRLVRPACAYTAPRGRRATTCCTSCATTSSCCCRRPRGAARPQAEFRGLRRPTARRQAGGGAAAGGARAIVRGGRERHYPRRATPLLFGAAEDGRGCDGTTCNTWQEEPKLAWPSCNEVCGCFVDCSEADGKEETGDVTGHGCYSVLATLLPRKHIGFCWPPSGSAFDAPPTLGARPLYTGSRALAARYHIEQP